MTDGEKLEQLYLLYEKPLYRIALAVLHDHMQAEDAVSETFYRIIKHIRKLGDPAHPQTKQYMIKVIRSISFSMYRQNQIESERFQPLDEKTDAIPDDSMTRRSLAEMIASLLGILNDTDRQIVIWHGRDGIGFAEIAANLDMTENAVRKRYERARKRMKSQYQKGEEHYEPQIHE
jgi:RNA polymerase sigma-70 factor (ECF subfamily)